MSAKASSRGLLLPVPEQGVTGIGKDKGCSLDGLIQALYRGIGKFAVDMRAYAYYC